MKNKKGEIFFDILKYTIAGIYLVLFFVNPLSRQNITPLYFLGIVVLLLFLNLFTPKYKNVISIFILLIVVFLCVNYFFPIIH